MRVDTVYREIPEPSMFVPHVTPALPPDPTKLAGFAIGRAPPRPKVAGFGIECRHCFAVIQKTFVV